MSLSFSIYDTVGDFSQLHPAANTMFPFLPVVIIVFDVNDIASLGHAR